MKFLIFRIIPVFILATVFSCSKVTTRTAPPDPIYETGTLITHNFLNEDLNIDWYNDAEIIVEGQVYGDGETREIEWVQGENDLTINSKNTTNDVLLASQEFTFNDGKSYSGILYGSLNKTLLISENNSNAPFTGNVKVQFANLYQNAGEIDIYIGGESELDKKVSSLEYGELSFYIELPKASIDASLIITPAGIAPDLGTNLLNIFDSDVHDVNEIYLDVISSETYDASTPLKLFITNQ